MSRLIWLTATLIALAFAGAARADEAVLGKWLTEAGSAQVEIKRCGDKLCGEVVWLKEPLADDGQEKWDAYNPDPTLRSRKILGLSMLSGFVKSAGAAERWEDGTIYNPEDGKTYKCTLTLENPNTLKVRGYVGIPLLGKTQIWNRVQ